MSLHQVCSRPHPPALEERLIIFVAKDGSNWEAAITEVTDIKAPFSCHSVADVAFEVRLDVDAQRKFQESRAWVSYAQLTHKAGGIVALREYLSTQKGDSLFKRLL